MESKISTLTQARAALEQALFTLAHRLATGEGSDPGRAAEIARDITAIKSALEALEEAVAAADRYQPDYFQNR